MNKVIIEEIKSRMKEDLLPEQIIKLGKVLEEVLNIDNQQKNKDLIKLFIFTKKSEGRSARTETYYTQVLRTFEKDIKNVRYATTEDIRLYLYNYQNKTKCSPLSIDNIRRILSSFYNWLENEDYIIKSPMRRIRKVKIPNTIKSVFTDENIVTMREICSHNKRNLAIFDLLNSSGLRVGELVLLNKRDINLENQTAIVYGKGSKERCIYFDVKTKIKGMPIEQVQVLLGHTKIDTTLRYAQVQQKNVRYSYQKYIG